MKANNNKPQMESIKALLQAANRYFFFFNERFDKIRPVLIAFSEGKQIQIQETRGWEDSDIFSFNLDPSNYRIKPEATVVEIEGKKYSVDLEKAEKLGLIKEIN